MLATVQTEVFLAVSKRMFNTRCHTRIAQPVQPGPCRIQFPIDSQNAFPAGAPVGGQGVAAAIRASAK